MINLDERGVRTAYFTDLSVAYSDMSKTSPDFARSYAFDPKLHSHTYTEILVVLRGSSKIVSVAEGITISAPYLVVYPAGVPHIQINNYGMGYERCLFSCHGDILDKYGCSHLLEDKNVYAFEVDEYSANVIKGLTLLIIAMENEDKKEVSVVMNKLFEVLARTGKNPIHIHESGEPLHEKSYFSTLLAYIVEHYNEKLSLTNLASMFYISRTKLARDFNAIMKMSVGEYIMLVRIKKAQEKLIRGVSIKDTAKKCGFVSSSYFVKMFKKYLRKTPHRYIKDTDGKNVNVTFMLDEKLVNPGIIKTNDITKTEENT